MTGHRRHARYVESNLKLARDTIMAQVMKMKVVDFQELSCACKGGSDRVGAIWKYLVRGSIFSPGFFMSRTSTRLPSVSRLTQPMRVISSCRRVEKIANAIIF
jgi:hypothetical protein